VRATFAIYFIWRNDLQVYSVAMLVHSSVASTSLTLAQGAPSASDSRLAADLAPRLPLVVSSATPGPGGEPRPFSADDLYLDPAILISPVFEIRPKGLSYSQNNLLSLTKSPRLLARLSTIPLS